MQHDLRHEETIDGFTIRFYREDEDESPRGQFQNEDGSDDEDTIRKIDNGTYDWFCVKVTASKEGIQLASDYLGGCCYESFEDFLTPDGYAADMRADIIAEAKRVLAQLCGA